MIYDKRREVLAGRHGDGRGACQSSGRALGIVVGAGSLSADMAVILWGLLIFQTTLSPATDVRRKPVILKAAWSTISAGCDDLRATRRGWELGRIAS